ncbi:MAG TPA: nitroreductase family protein [Kofleriaceae bacterium]|nr:nitroreductase family protein [Kofleriaceae bacterium]
MSSGLDDALRCAVAVARHAPSSHNSQPWALAAVRSRPGRTRCRELVDRTSPARTASADRPAEPRHIVLALDGARELTALDDHRVEMFVSCGAYLHLLLGALRAGGWRASRIAWNEDGERGWLSAPGLPEEWLPLAVVELAPFDPGPPHELDELGRLAERRITNRAPYLERPLAPPLLESLAGPARPALPSPPAVGVQLVTDRARIASIGGFVARTAGIDFAHPAAWRETHRFIRWSRAEPIEDGFPIEQLFGPMSRLRKLLVRAALAPITLLLFARLGYAGYLARQLGRLVGGAPALAAFSLPSERPAISQQVAGGAEVMDFWLRATAAGVALHPVSVLLQHAAIRERFQREHGLSGRVFFFARLGYPAASFPPAPRRRDPWSAVAAL